MTERDCNQTINRTDQLYSFHMTMALRYLLSISSGVKRNLMLRAVKTVPVTRFRSHHQRRDSHSSTNSENKTDYLKWSIPLGLCLTAFGTGVFMHWTRDSFQPFSEVPAVPPTGDSGSDGIGERFNSIADVVETVEPSVVSIKCGSLGQGSGFIVSSDGLIVTCSPTVADDATTQVRLIDGREFEGRLESIDRENHLAFVRIAAENLPVLKLGSLDTLRPGETVIAIGDYKGSSTSVSCGIVSRKGPAYFFYEPLSKSFKLNEVIQTDLIPHNHSHGAPLINLDGEAVGVLLPFFENSEISGITFAISINFVKDFLNSSNSEYEHTFPSEKKF